MNLSEKVADSYRLGMPSKANPGNRITARRRKLFSTIKERTGGDPETEMQFAMEIIRKNRPKIDAYIISKNEVPLDTNEDATLQAYQLRCNEIEQMANILGVSEAEAGIFIEDDESENEDANNYEQENSIGELFAPIGIAAKHISGGTDSNSFVDENLIIGAINTLGAKFDAGALKRAAQDKSMGIAGFISGGKDEYNMLRAYLQDPKNADEKAKVLSGVIKDVRELRGYGGTAGTSGQGTGVKLLAKDVIDEIARQKKREAINKALPFIIIGIAAIILITVLIVKRAKSK